MSLCLPQQYSVCHIEDETGDMWKQLVIHFGHYLDVTMLNYALHVHNYMSHEQTPELLHHV